MPERIYLDNAATSWPKPPEVYGAVLDYLRDNGAPAGRSGYREASDAERLVAHTRLEAARLLGLPAPEQLIFTASGTDALNQAIHGLVHPGDHVVTSVLDHNSVLRPLRFLEQHHQVRVTRCGCDAQGQVRLDELEQALREGARLVAIVHASNVTGILQPVTEIAQLVRQHQSLLLLDAAQTVGHFPLDLEALGADLLAAPAHKGLLAPSGLGILAVGRRARDRIVPTRQGGTGSRSESDQQPDQWPDRLEAGSLNVAAIAGLGAGIAYLKKRSLEAVWEHESALAERLSAALSGLPGVHVLAGSSTAPRLAVTSICVDGFSPHEFSAMLDAAARVQTRAGFHCAPLLHRTLGTLQNGGAVRFSIGCMTTETHIDQAVEALAMLAAT